MKNIDHGIFPEGAARVGISTSPDGKLGISFYRTFTSPNVSRSIEDHILTIAVNSNALGELYLLLKDRIEKEPTKYGFEIKK